MKRKSKVTLVKIVRALWGKAWGNRDFRFTFKMLRLIVLTLIVVQSYSAIVSAAQSNEYIEEPAVNTFVELPKPIDMVKKVELEVEEEPKENVEDMGDFVITAYDLSFQSCEKDLDDPWYGITASGYDISGMTREEAMVIAVDPTVIPLGSKVRLTFYDEYHQQFNGVYTSKDVGGAIKGLRIDLFMGDFEKYEASAEAMEFGVTDAKVEILLD